MTQKFDIPSTPTIGVPYMRNGVKYMTTIKNPGSNDGLQMALLQKGIGIGQVVAPLVAVKPTISVQRTYAQHRAAQYMAAMERR